MNQSKLRFQSYYERNLPHLHSHDYPIFITWREAFTIPASIKQDIEKEITAYRKTHESDNLTAHDLKSKLEKRRFVFYDNVLAYNPELPSHLGNHDVAEIVSNAIEYYNNQRYNLISYCIMPNHVHLIIVPLDDGKGEKYSLASIMHSIKRFSAYKINKLMKKAGAFWQREFYDRVIRSDAELANCINYILNNPVKAGWVDNWKDWRFTFLNDQYLSYLPAE
jgi:putative transposase